MSNIIGNPNEFVGMTIELRTIGPVPVIVGQGVVGLVGESTRGPTGEAIGMGTWTDAVRYFHSGDLKEAIELVFQQGAPVVYAIRVLGDGNAKASYTVTDGLGVPNTVGTFYAHSEGAWGNSVKITLEDDTYKGTEFEDEMPGNGTATYYTANCNLYNNSSNFVKVNNVAKTIVYNIGDIGAGKVYLNIADGYIQFYTGEFPTSSDTISYSVKYHTKKVTITDNEVTFIYPRVVDLVRLTSKIEDSGLATFTAVDGETHMPQNGTYVLAGGSDGAAIDSDDWEEALYDMGEEASLQAGSPTCIAITDNTINSGQHELVPILDGFLTDMESDFHPCLGFVAADPNMTVDELLDLASNFNSRLLSIVANGWDDGDIPKNIAVCRAGREAAMPLGESAAKAVNAMKGILGILNPMTQNECDVLNGGGLDVIIKKRGILPYVGISTATDWQFMRCVDNRTINYIIVATEYIARAFYHEKRTPRVLSSIKNSIKQMLDDLKHQECIRAYTLEIEPHPTDTGRVNIYMSVENIGHIERFRTTLSVGILEGVE